MKESRMVGGRIGVHVPDHPASNNRGYILRSRYVMEQHLGRLLRSDEHVHHLDGDKLNDVVENLEIVSLQEHIKLHSIWPKRIDWEKVRALRNEGLGCKRIAKLLGCSKSSVCYVFKELGI